MLGIPRPLFTLRVAARLCETLTPLCTANHEIKKKKSGTRLFSDVRLLIIFSISMMVSRFSRTFGQKTSPSVKLDELFYHGAAVAVNDDRAVLDLHRTDSFVVIQAGVNR